MKSTYEYIMQLLAVNFADKTLDDRGRCSDATPMVIILSVTLERSSRGSRSFKRRQIPPSPLLIVEIKEDNNKASCLVSAKRKIRTEYKCHKAPVWYTTGPSNAQAVLYMHSDHKKPQNTPSECYWHENVQNSVA